MSDTMRKNERGCLPGSGGGRRSYGEPVGERDGSDETDDDPETHVGHGEVVGSEAPDMGGGPASGVDEL